MPEDAVPVGGAESFSGMDQLIQPERLPPRDPVVRQLIVGAAHIGLGAHGELHQHGGLRPVTGFQQSVRPFLQGAYKQGIVLVVFR